MLTLGSIKFQEVETLFTPVIQEGQVFPLTEKIMTTVVKIQSWYNRLRRLITHAKNVHEWKFTQ